MPILCYFVFADSLMPYSCTGQFHTDFAELCRRTQPPFIYTPAIVLRPHRPPSPTPFHAVEEKTTKPGKSKKELEKSHPAAEHEKPGTPSLLEKGGCNL